MLGKIRKNKNLILWILLVLIVPPFVFFGIESAFFRSEDPLVGKLFGKKIFYSDFLKEKTFAITMMNLLQQRAVDPSLHDPMVWQRLLLLNQAKKTDITVSDAELSENIIKIFSKDKFNPETYELYIRNVLKLSVFEFEKAFRETLLIEKFQDTLSALVQISDPEMLESYLYENEKLDVTYCEIPYDHFAPSIKSSEMDLKDFYEKNKESLKIDIQRKVRYIALPVADFKSKTSITPDAIEKYYQKNKSRFDKPLKDVQAQIEDELTAKEAHKKALDLSKKIHRLLADGKSLKKIRKKYNFAIQKTEFFTASNPPQFWTGQKYFIQSIFEEKLKEVLDPVFVQDVCYLVVPDREKPPYIPDFNEVQDKVRDLLIEEKARNESKIEAQKAQEKVVQVMKEKGVAFLEASKATGEKAEKIPLFARSENQLQYDPLGMLKRQAWSQSPNVVSDIVPTLKGYAFYFVENSISPDLTEYEKKKDTLKERTLNQKRQKLFYEYYSWLLKQCEFYDTKIQGR